jgi:Isochorismatase family
MAERAGQGVGTWRRYYERWASMTLEALGAEMAGIVPALAAFVPPATVIDKRVYTPWYETSLDEHIKRQQVGTLIISGGETDVCVLSTVLGAVDRGYRVVLATDTLCSSSDEAHDASISLYENRYAQQVEAVSSEVILASWRRFGAPASTMARDAKVRTAWPPLWPRTSSRGVRFHLLCWSQRVYQQPTLTPETQLRRA